MSLETVRLLDVHCDNELQSRVATDRRVVEEYAELLAVGVALPPPKVVKDEAGMLWPWDGRHTLEAHYARAKGSGYHDEYLVDVDVQAGTRDDATLLAAGANGTHGLRRSRDDKRRAVLMVLGHAACAQWSDRKIADHCHVSHTFVGNVRAERDAMLTGRAGTEAEEPDPEKPEHEFVEPGRVATLPLDADDPDPGEDEQATEAASAQPSGADTPSSTSTPPATPGPTVWELLKKPLVGGDAEPAKVVRTAGLTPGTPEWREFTPRFVANAIQAILRDLDTLPSLCRGLLVDRIWEHVPGGASDWDSYCSEVLSVDPALLRGLLDLHGAHVAPKDVTEPAVEIEMTTQETSPSEDVNGTGESDAAVLDAPDFGWLDIVGESGVSGLGSPI